MLKVIEALQEKGIDCVKIDVPNAPEMLESNYNVYMNDGNTDGLFDTSKHGTVLDASYRDVKIVMAVPNCIKNILGSLIKKFYSAKAGALLRCGIVHEPFECLLMNSKMKGLAKKYSEILSKNHIDLVISPGFGIPATKLRTAADNSIIAFFTSFFNCTG